MDGRMERAKAPASHSANFSALVTATADWPLQVCAHTRTLFVPDHTTS